MRKEEEIEKKMRRKSKMCLENYEAYLENRNENDLTVNHLRQIIYMHGFTKLYGASNVRKDVFVNAVSTINLLVPFRSTLELKDEVSPCAFLTIEEVMEDLSILEWQECLVQSVETLSSGKVKDASTLDQSVRESIGKLNARKKLKVKNEIVGAKALALAPNQSSASVLSHGSC